MSARRHSPTYRLPVVGRTEIKEECAKMMEQWVTDTKQNTGFTEIDMNGVQKFRCSRFAHMLWRTSPLDLGACGLDPAGK